MNLFQLVPFENINIGINYIISHHLRFILVFFGINIYFLMWYNIIAITKLYHFSLSPANLLWLGPFFLSYFLLISFTTSASAFTKLLFNKIMLLLISASSNATTISIIIIIISIILFSSFLAILILLSISLLLFSFLFLFSPISFMFYYIL